VRHRIIIGVIAFSQLLLSLLSSMAGMTYLGGPLFLLYGIWGLITAVALVPSSTWARKSAIAWHTIFVAYVVYGVLATSNQPHYSQRYWFPLLWAAGGLAAIFYLASGLDRGPTVSP
jgi:hypothetical protein